MSNATDIELMQQVRHGSESALREVIERHRERLFRLACRLLGDRDDASDAVQETFIRLWRHARRYDPRQSLAAWLCTICARRCYDELRRRQRHRKALAEMPVETAQPDTMGTDELLTLLHQVVTTLPPKQQVVYQLREIECLSTDEVARATRLNADQVKANLHVARTTVREKLKHYGI
ncbi:MAG: RNA polymerase sigma factor [Bacteroidales bacterium]|nr:RNA polymerase sigma factor [Bacteroidales bacterium]